MVRGHNVIASYSIYLRRWAVVDDRPCVIVLGALALIDDSADEAVVHRDQIGLGRRLAAPPIFALLVTQPSRGLSLLLGVPVLRLDVRQLPGRLPVAAVYRHDATSLLQRALLRLDRRQRGRIELVEERTALLGEVLHLDAIGEARQLVCHQRTTM